MLFKQHLNVGKFKSRFLFMGYASFHLETLSSLIYTQFNVWWSHYL